MSTENVNQLTEKSFGLSVTLDGKEFLQFRSLTINKAVSQFVDTFSLTIANPQGRNSTVIPVGGIMSVYLHGTELFRGILEKKTVNYPKVGSTITFAGREEMALMVEDDIDPNLPPFKDSTDNEIIQKACETVSWSFELEEAVDVKEYTIPGGSVRRGQVLDDMAKYNDFVIFKKGNTLVKKKIPTSGSGSEKFVMTVLDGEFHIENDRISSVEIFEDITGVRGNITGFTFQKGKDKVKEKVEEKNESITSGNYARRLRNNSSLTGYPIPNMRYLTTTGKDEDELRKQVKRALRDTDIKCYIKLVVAGIYPIDLLDIVDVQLEAEKIVQYMYVDSIEYKYEQDNKTTTTITVKPFPVVSN